MKILSINAGSSSLKFTLIELPSNNTIASGLFEKIGLANSFYSISYNGEKITKDADLTDHSVAVNILIDELVDMNIISSLEEIEGVGHRIVHGGDEFSESVVLTEEVLKEIEKYNDLAPLHNPANILGVRAFLKILPNVINVGVFDTAFHQTIEKENFLYPVPYEWYEDYGVRKYGFHGTSHKFVDLEISKELNRNDLKVINCHIGNGASICAIDSGKVVDTSMGLTPLAGVMMGTRSGDIDTSILEYMSKKTGKTLEELTSDLNKKSGLLGISKSSSDAREIQDLVDKEHELATLAQDIYARKVANYIATYNNLLGGADVITFTAGVGENSIQIREKIISKVKSLGVVLDKEANNNRGKLLKISSDESKILVYIVPTNEELMIALETLELKNK